jgi:hypothetical protein
VEYARTFTGTSQERSNRDCLTRSDFLTGLEAVLYLQRVSGALAGDVSVIGPIADASTDGAANQQCCEQILDETTFKHGRFLTANACGRTSLAEHPEYCWDDLSPI